MPRQHLPAPTAGTIGPCPTIIQTGWLAGCFVLKALCRHSRPLPYYYSNWLAGCFVFNGPLSDISVYIGPSPREREKEERNDRREKKNPNNITHTYYKRSKALPYNLPK